VLTLATGKDHCLALDFDGKIYGWGDNSRGQVIFYEFSKKKHDISLL
jgi:alpha-tubulin suppressor-like RCC1 family protein